VKSLFNVLYLVILVLSLSIHAQVEVKVDPPSPVKGESFNVIFKIKTDSGDEPYVSFTPVGLEVLGRRQEVSLQTTMINGKFSSSRNYNLIYEMVSDKQRTARLNGISIEVGSKKYTHKPVLIRVLGQRKKASPLFLQAEVSKNKIFVGEGIDVKYYLYSRVQVIQTEIKSFPKLKGFIKRFHKVDEREQRVEYNGLVYKRSLKYSARVYPEKTGKLSIDPLRLVLQYSSGRSSPFGGIGFGFGRFRSKGVNSPKVEVEVSPLPAENVPPHFTGLVGKHDFSFTQAKNKFVVNEAIEGTLEVRGPGALEKFEAPALYTSPYLEQFDAKSEFVEVGTSSGRKTFEYTYLARANLSIEEKTLPLAYFDPDTQAYVTIDLSLPPLKVIGGANAAGVSVEPDAAKSTPPQDSPAVVAPKTEKKIVISAPLFSESWGSLPVRWPFYVNAILLIGLVLFILELIFHRLKGHRSRSSANNLIVELKKDGLNYSKLSQLIFLLDKNGVGNGGELSEILKNSQMPQKDIDYFLEVLELLERKSFASSQTQEKKARFRASAFNELKKVIDHESL
jgi:hypothetical protein